MATVKKEEEVKPKPANAVIYLPDTDESVRKHLYPQYHEEGKNGCKKITLLAHNMIEVEMEDGEQLVYSGHSFTYRKYPEPIKKPNPTL